MWKFIILIIANFIILKLFRINILKHLLFNPKINAAIVGLGIVMNIIGAVVDRRNMWMIIPWIISILDCIQDVIWGENYYGSVEEHISPLYAVKCISSMLTRGLSRAVFLIFTSLCIPRIAQADVKATFEGKIPVEVDPQYPYGSSFVANFFDRFYSQEFLRFVDPYIKNTVLYVMGNLFEGQNVVRYSTILGNSYRCPYTDDQFVKKYCGEYRLHESEIKSKIRNSIEKGSILTNEKCVDEEFQLRRFRLARAYPQKLMQKFAEMVTEEGKKALAERKNAEKELSSEELLYTYIDSNFYEDCKRTALEALSKRATMPVRSIVKLEELSFLNELQEKDFKLDQRWREYFIIFIMQSLVKDGMVQEGAAQEGVVQVGIDQKESCLTGISDTHQYSVVGGKGIIYNSKEDHPDLEDPELGECCG